MSGLPLRLLHGGGTDESNLALACFHCNVHKGPNLTAIDRVSGLIVRLFNPRLDDWDEHFERQGPMTVGKTDVGRATLLLLAMNAPARVRLRSLA